MNMFNSKRGPQQTSKKKPVVHREVVPVPSKSSIANQQPASHVSLPYPKSGRFQLSQRLERKGTTEEGSGLKTLGRRALAASRGLKRKQSTTPQPVFSDDEDLGSSDFGTSDSDVSRKRNKSRSTSVEQNRLPNRCLVCQSAFGKQRQNLVFIHGEALTSEGQDHKYTSPWDEDQFESVVLQYPSFTNGERFELKWPKVESDDYKPMEDIIETIKQVIAHYFPEELRRKHSDDSTGFARRFNRAWQRQSVSEFVDLVNEFNGILSPLVEQGAIERVLSATRSLDIDWVRRILDQIYSRTVSPKVESLRAYENGSDYVYGELFPRFISDIFRRTKLNARHTFIDLGSGVGNVVLQAALEIGCESYGIEIMTNPSILAALQAQEFAARTRLWGLNAGRVHLLEGDMTEHCDVPAILQRADIVLVNNQAFTPQLNDKLCTLFLDLKPGAQVVSLKPFVPEGHKMSLRNIDSVVNQFVQCKYEYFSESVSWSYYGNAHWYIATKDLRPLNTFRKYMGLDEA